MVKKETQKWSLWVVGKGQRRYQQHLEFWWLSPLQFVFWGLMNLTLFFSELMMLGFLSMLLTVFQDPLSKICISQNAASTWHPCSNPKAVSNSNATSHTIDRKLLHLDPIPRRVLAAKGYDKCADKASWKPLLTSLCVINKVPIVWNSTLWKTLS